MVMTDPLRCRNHTASSRTSTMWSMLYQPKFVADNIIQIVDRVRQAG
jgi:hypothetical protein